MTTQDLFTLLPDIDTYRKSAESELGDYYAHFDSHAAPLIARLNEIFDTHPDDSPYRRKARLYDCLADECPVKLFRSSPFFFEMASGRERFSWGGLQSPVGSYLQHRSSAHWLAPYNAAIDSDRREGFMHGWSPVGFDHHCLGYDRLLTIGVNGIIAKAEAALADCTDEKPRDFYTCVISANRALIRLADRFRAEAERLAALASDAAERKHFEMIARAAANVPAKPASSFYEGLCVILFCRECIGSLDGIGVSIFGGLDRMLWPLYKADLESGKLTREDALRLLCDLLLYTEIRFDTAHCYRETSTTIGLGGCDGDGELVYNELTELILSAVYNVRSLGTKINCRISKRHPKQYLRMIAGIQSSNLPTLMMHNDDVLIPARVRRDQDIRDARIYAGGGCHEVVLCGTEVSTRADCWISLPRILLEALKNGGEFADFGEFYAKLIADVRAYHDKICALKNEGEQYWRKYSPHVLYSSTLEGPLEKGLDITEGGAKYNTTSLSMVGCATLIDSLDAIKRIVFEEKIETLESFAGIVGANFEGHEELRARIVHELPKYGTNDEYMNSFAASVLSDISKVSGQTNARGGKYLPAFYPHDIFRELGGRCGATPDGRLAGMPLSRGASPSEFVKVASPLELVHSLKPIDFTEFADSFIAELTLPRIDDTETALNVLTSIIEVFLDSEGSSLQFNMIDRDRLIEAKTDPELHPNLSVRVCGYSALFSTLDGARQDEIIARAVR